MEESCTHPKKVNRKARIKPKLNRNRRGQEKKEHTENEGKKSVTLAQCSVWRQKVVNMTEATLKSEL